MSERAQKIRVSLLVLAPLLGTLFAGWLLWERYVFWSDLLLLGVFYVLTGLGITIGYHRMLTHQGFEAHPFLRGCLLILGCMALEGSPDIWAATHLKHHAHSDQEDDPHSPLDGFWHAHFGWLFSLRNFPAVREYTPHLLEDRLVQFISRSAPLWVLLSLLLPALLGGWTGFLWGGLVRIFLVNHVTWSVNSVCHSFGKRPFETMDESRNEWVVGLLAFGEGWHNNHHAFPHNAFHGLHWWQFDLSGLLIRLSERFGFVWQVQRVTSEAIKAKRKASELRRRALGELQEYLRISVESAKEELASFAVRIVETSRRIASPQRSLFREVPHPSISLRQTLDRLKEHYARKLDELQRMILQRRNLRKLRRELLREEIREILERAKQAMREEVGRQRLLVSA